MKKSNLKSFILGYIRQTQTEHEGVLAEGAHGGSQEITPKKIFNSQHFQPFYPRLIQNLDQYIKIFKRHNWVLGLRNVTG